ncbi:MAG: PAS domain S-box protein [Burkholderiales bacterium]
MKLQSYLSRLIWIAIAPLLVVATVFAVNDIRELRDTTARDARDLATNVAGAIDRQLGFRTAAMQMLAADSRLVDPAWQREAYRDAQNFARTFDISLSLAEPDGRMVWNTRVPLGTPLPNLPAVSGTSAAKTALATGKPAVGDPFVGPVTAQRQVGIAVPVVRDDKTVALLIATIGTAALDRALGSLALPAGWRVELRDSTGAPIAQAGPAATDVERGTPIAARLDNARWTLAVEVPPLLASSDVRESAALLALLLVTATFAAVLGGRIAARRLARDLTTLADPLAAGVGSAGGDIVEVRRIGDQLAALDRARRDSEAQLVDDLAARKRMEDALRSTTSTLQATLEGMSDALAIFDGDGRLRQANDAFLSMHGFATAAEAGTALANPDFLAVRTVDGTRVEPDRRLLRRALRGESATGIELRIVRQDTGRTWVASYSAAPIRDEGGAITGAVITAQDVTARRAAEDAMRASEARLRLLVEHAPAAIAIFDRKMRYLAVSQRWHDDYTLGERDVVGHSHYEVFPEIGDDWRAVHGRALAGEIVRNDEDAFVRADGTTQWLRWEVRPWRTDDGGIGGIVIFTEDITASKRAQLALRDSERRFRDIVEATADWIWETDAQWRYTYVSDSVEAALGYRPAEVIGRTPFDFMPADEAARVHAAFAAAAAQGAPLRNAGHVNVHRSGELRHMQTSARPVLSADGQVIGYRGLGHDVTEQERAALTLRESEARYRELFEANPHPMWVYDPATLRFLAVNDAAVAQYGYSREEFLAMTIADIRPAGDVARLREAVDAQVDNAPPRLWHHRRKDGSLISVEISSHRLQFDAHNAVVVLANDVTRRLAAEQQLRKLSMAIEQSPSAVVITDPGWHVEYVNEAFVATTGYAREEILGRSVLVLRSPNVGTPEEPALSDTLAAGRAWHGEFTNRRKDGTDYVASAVVAPIREADGTVTHFVAVQEDITEKKRLAEELDHHRHHLADLVELRTAELSVATRAATAANAAKSAFLTNMSHEIRTPMNAVLGFAYLLRRSGVTAQQQDWIDKLTTAGEHLLLLINDILDLSKIESGKLVLESVDFPLQTIVDNVRSLVWEQARRKNLVLTTDCDDVPVWLRGDPTRLRQALLNFAGNAVKFTDAGRIAISARLMREEAQGVLVRFEVSDTGAGVAEARLATLFEAFRQGDDSTTRKHGGTGLGLAITRRLAEAMGGEAGATSRVGIGSTFWFTAWLARGEAPRPVATPAAGNPESELRARHAGTRILLVEDDPINQEVAVILLADVGLVVDVAHDGEQAVAMVSDAHRLVLMDLQMPRMDGFEATRAIRALPGRAPIPILAMTANAFDEDRRRCLEAGMDDFLAKPFDPADLYATVCRWLEA